MCDAAQQLQGESTLLQIARFALKRTQTETLRLHRVADTAKELEEAVRNRQVAAGLQLQHAQARTHQAQVGSFGLFPDQSNLACQAGIGPSIAGRLTGLGVQAADCFE